MKTRIWLALLLVILLFATFSFSQVTKPLDEKETAAAEELFEKANAQLEKKEYADALSKYQAALKLLPDDPAILYNAGFAALLGKEYITAADLLARLKKVDPEDWQVRAKLVQVFQALGKIPERDREREDLIALWKKGNNKELKEQIEFCRERFSADGRDVMAFELFEFKGLAGSGMFSASSMILERKITKYR